MQCDGQLVGVGMEGQEGGMLTSTMCLILESDMVMGKRADFVYRSHFVGFRDQQRCPSGRLKVRSLNCGHGGWRRFARRVADYERANNQPLHRPESAFALSASKVERPTAHTQGAPHACARDLRDPAEPSNSRGDGSM